MQLQASTISLPNTRERFANEKAECNVLLVGLGPHACRTYVPHLMKLGPQHNARLAAIVELEGAQAEVEGVCVQHGISPERLYVPPFPSYQMPANVRPRLDEIVHRHRINGIIISTEPLAHKAYLEYALRSGLNVLVDKPLTTRRDVAHDLDQARGIYDDYLEILAEYEALQRRETTCLLVNSQRRWHPGFQFARDLVSEIRDQFNQPITDVSALHCDGQWRLPAEIITQIYHPYNTGYGKVSHSGYHSIDTLKCFLKAGQIASKAPQTVALTSSLVFPNGFIRQLGREDYQRLFGAAYEEVCPHTDAELIERTARFGEIDAKAMLEFRREGDVITTAEINLRHNGFSRRTWLRPGADLYKGNGRVRHERWEITSGSLQAIQIESYQAKDKHDQCGPKDFERGGNNHFDIWVYRNPITGSKPMEFYRLADLPETSGFDTSGLYNEQAKEAALIEFLRFMRGELTLEQLHSNIDDHQLTVRMMAGIYESHVLRHQGAGGWIEFPLEDGHRHG